jgi:hypothetical protein
LPDAAVRAHESCPRCFRDPAGSRRNLVPMGRAAPQSVTDCISCSATPKRVVFLWMRTRHGCGPRPPPRSCCCPTDHQDRQAHRRRTDPQGKTIGQGDWARRATRRATRQARRLRAARHGRGSKGWNRWRSAPDVGGCPTRPDREQPAARHSLADQPLRENATKTNTGRWGPSRMAPARRRG